MRRRGTPVSREAPYEEVWPDAVTVVAPRYGLSDVGLAGIRKSRGIPLPGLGHRLPDSPRKTPTPTRSSPAPVSI